MSAYTLTRGCYLSKGELQYDKWNYKTDKQTNNDMIVSRNSTDKKENADDNNKVEKTESNEKYLAVSKDGDTLEISKDSDNKKVDITDKTNVRLSEASLKKYPKEKLKQFLNEGKISRQQYDKIVNNKLANQDK